MALSEDGKKMATVASNGETIIYDVESGKVLWKNVSTNTSITSVAFSPDGRKVVTAGNWLTEVFNADSGKSLFKFEHEGAWVASAAFSFDSKKIVLGGNGYAKVISADTDRELLNIPDNSGIFSVAFSPDGKRIIMVGSGAYMKEFDAQSAKRLTNNVYGKTIASSAISHDGKMAAIGYHDGTLVIYDIKTGEELQIIEDDSIAKNIAFSPDGQNVITTREDSYVKIWQVNPVTSQGASKGSLSGLKPSNDFKPVTLKIKEYKPHVYDSSPEDGLAVNVVPLVLDGPDARSQLQSLLKLASLDQVQFQEARLLYSSNGVSMAIGLYSNGEKTPFKLIHFGLSNPQFLGDIESEMLSSTGKSLKITPNMVINLTKVVSIINPNEKTLIIRVQPDAAMITAGRATVLLFEDILGESYLIKDIKYIDKFGLTIAAASGKMTAEATLKLYHEIKKEIGQELNGSDIVGLTIAAASGQKTAKETINLYHEVKKEIGQEWKKSDIVGLTIAAASGQKTAKETINLYHEIGRDLAIIRGRKPMILLI